jgi:cell division septation protein DedD
MAEERPAKSYEPSATGGFTVQVGAGTNEMNANYLAEKFIDRGYEAFVTQVYIDDVLHYRVRVGNYDTFDEATRIGHELADKYSVDFWVDNNI